MAFVVNGVAVIRLLERKCVAESPVGIEGRKERAMLALIERAQFDAFITNDKKMGAEGQLSRRPFAILIPSATSWNLIKPHVGNIADALEAAKPGEVARVDVGPLGRKPDPPTARQAKMHRCPESYLLGKNSGKQDRPLSPSSPERCTVLTSLMQKSTRRRGRNSGQPWLLKKSFTPLVRGAKTVLLWG